MWVSKGKYGEKYIFIMIFISNFVKNQLFFLVFLEFPSMNMLLYLQKGISGPGIGYGFGN